MKTRTGAGHSAEGGRFIRWRPGSGVTRLCCAAIFSGVLAVALGGEESPSDWPADPLAGRALLESKLCTSCHTLEPTSRGAGPSITSIQSAGSFLELGAALWNHAPTMSDVRQISNSTWPQLSARETIGLLSFVYFIDYLGRPGIPADGEKVFRERGCSDCHGIGRPGRIGPDLTDSAIFASPIAVAQGVWNHGPSMLGRMRDRQVRQTRFAKGDLADLSAFLRQKSAGGLSVPRLSAPGNPNTGLALFSHKGCAACHGADATGGRGGPDLTQFNLRIPAEAIAGTMWNHALRMNDAMGAQGIKWPKFEDSELSDMLAFLYFLSFNDPKGDPARGRRVFAAASCAECHGSSEPTPSEGQQRSVDLTTNGDFSSPAALVATMWNHAPIMKKAILSKGRPWPVLSGADLRDLFAYLSHDSKQSEQD